MEIEIAHDKSPKALRERIKEISRRRRARNVLAVRGAERAMEVFKFEVARELDLLDRIREVGFENMTTKECGSIGGLMTRRMVEYAQIKMMEELERTGKLQHSVITDVIRELWGYGREIQDAVH